MSISVWSSMCPMCSDPVTFGGGMTIENTGPGAFASALNSASFTQKSAHRGSICCGSYAFAISRAIPMRFSRATAGPGPAVLEQLRSFRVIFHYTRGKAVASIWLDVPLPGEIEFGGALLVNGSSKLQGRE